MSPAPGSLRLRPPPVPTPPAARWALRRAFGPPAPAETIAADGATTWSARLGLVERIAWRCDSARLAAELGAEPAAGFAAAARRTAARNLLLRELAAAVVAAAARREIPLLLLKGMALLERIPDLDAGRPLADVDVLTAPAAARELARELQSRGFAPSPVHESAHHLPALSHPRLGLVEIHLYLPGVGGDASRPVGAAELLAGGHCAPARQLAPALVPSAPVLAAHAIAHALVQNAHSPDGYPLLRLIADLQDVGGDGGPSRLAAAAAPWLAASVSRREIAAVGELGRLLARGSPPPPGSDPAVLLEHVLAAHLEPGYRRALKVRAFGAAVRRRDWLKIRRRAALAARRGRLPAALGGVFRVGWSWLAQRLQRRGAADLR